MRGAPAILYRSETVLAVDKPAGMIVHGDGTGASTLTDLVRSMLGPADAPSDAARDLQALNRLDRATSGIVLFSTDKRTQPLYDALIAEHRLTKEYRAVVRGKLPWEQRTFSGPIGRDRHDARRMRVSRTGKPAVTHVRVLATGRRKGAVFTLLAIEIETGRKHQIRVHLSSAGFPIVGDDLYGRPNPDGLMLHAHLLRFEDPVLHSPVTITAPLPARFTRLFPGRAR